MRRHRTEIRVEILNLYGAAVELAASTSEWAAFCRDESWGSAARKRPCPENSQTALQHVMRFACGISGQHAQKRAEKYAKALQGAFDAKLNIEEADRYLSGRGGINKSAQMAREETKATSEKTSADPIEEKQRKGSSPKAKSAAPAERQVLKARQFVLRDSEKVCREALEEGKEYRLVVCINKIEGSVYSGVLSKIRPVG